MHNTTDMQRARWCAELAIAYAARMTDADRLKLLNSYYDIANLQGATAERKMVNDELRADLEKERDSLLGTQHQSIQSHKA